MNVEKVDTESLKWLRIGDRESEQSYEGTKRSTIQAVTSGFAYKRAESARRHGDWITFVQRNSSRPLRTVQSHMQLSNELLELAGFKEEDVPDIAEQEKVVFAMLNSDTMMRSPKPLIRHYR